MHVPVVDAPTFGCMSHSQEEGRGMNNTRTVTHYLTLAALLLSTPVFAAQNDVSPDADLTPIVEHWAQPQPVNAAWFNSAGIRGSEFLPAGNDPEGDMPREVAYLPSGDTVLVVHRDTDNVMFFDVDTQTVTDVVDVGDFPVSVTITPDGSLALVPNILDHTVSVIDVPTRTLAATVPITGEQPFLVKVTTDGSLAIVGVITDGSTSRFSVIDLNTYNETLSFPCAPQGVNGFFWSPETGGFGNLFTDFDITPDGSTIVLPDSTNSQVVLYDVATGNVLAELPTAGQANAVDISATGTFAAVAHGGNPGAIAIIDLINQSVDAVYPVNDYTTSSICQITPDDQYVIGAISNNAIFMDLATGNITATLYTGTVGDVEISSDDQYAFVSNYNASVISLASQSIVKQITIAACVEAATSPTENRAVALNNRFGEGIHFYNINGASGYAEGQQVSGMPPEGDDSYAVAVSPAGDVAVVTNVTSDNVTIFDLTTNTARAWVDVGDRPKDVQITPDGNYAVVCAMDANYVRVIDLSTDSVAASLYIYRRPGRVLISPDSQYAYVLNVAGTDMISFIHLDGENSAIETQLPAGQTGSANGPLYTETSGIALSPDGSILAVCDSFNDYLRLFDTATQTQITQVLVGDFPLRAAFSPDGNRIYVTNHFGNSVSVVEYNGSTWGVVGTVSSYAYPMTIAADADYFYFGNNSSGPALRVVDAHTLNVVKTFSYAEGYPRDTYLDDANNLLYVAGTNSELLVIQTDGANSSIVASHPLTAPPCDLAVSPLRGLAAIAEPVPDGVDIYSPLTPGDLDCDGDVDFDDISAFILALNGQAGYEAAYPDCEWLNADTDFDGDVDFDDIVPFVNLIGS